MITINYFDPRINKVLGSIYTHHSEAISLGRDILAGIKGVLGGPSDLYKKKINDTVQGAIDAFTAEIKNRYPNATQVIGLKFELMEFTTQTNQRLNELGSKAKDAVGWLSFLGNFISDGGDYVPENYIEAPELRLPQYRPQEGGGGSYIVATVIGNVIGPI